MRIYFTFALLFAGVVVSHVQSALAQSDPFAAGSGSADGSAGSGTAGGSAAPLPGRDDAEPSRPSPACEHVTKQICGAQDSALLIKSAAYVVISVLMFSLLRIWWDKRGTRTAGVRFVATLVPAALGAGALAYVDPTRGQDLRCCLASSIFKNQILFQDSSLARSAVLGALPALALFVIVAIILKAMRS